MSAGTGPGVEPDLEFLLEPVPEWSRVKNLMTHQYPEARDPGRGTQHHPLFQFATVLASLSMRKYIRNAVQLSRSLSKYLKVVLLVILFHGLWGPNIFCSLLISNIWLYLKQGDSQS